MQLRTKPENKLMQNGVFAEVFAEKIKFYARYKCKSKRLHFLPLVFHLSNANPNSGIVEALSN